MSHSRLVGLEHALEGLLSTAKLSGGKLESKYNGNSQVDENAGTNEDDQDQDSIQEHSNSQTVLV